ncbi:MAG TPA: class I SAM-dependent methyltransferase [Bryobacteraceae bacterium]
MGTAQIGVIPSSSPSAIETYHLEELKVALDPAHPNHILPPPIAVSKRVLDIGCGAGQTLIARYPDRFSFGIDIDADALRLGRSLTDRIGFACATAERLPFPDAHFDMVVARVSLAYANLRKELKEIHRVLREDGQLWMTLNQFSFAWKQAKGANWKGRAFFGYVFLNSAAFHLVQRQFSFLGRYESFQTAKGMSRALRQSGFDSISATQAGSAGQHLLVTARRRRLH